MNERRFHRKPIFLLFSLSPNTNRQQKCKRFWIKTTRYQRNHIDVMLHNIISFGSPSHLFHYWLCCCCCCSTICNLAVTSLLYDFLLLLNFFPSIIPKFLFICQFSGMFLLIFVVVVVFAVVAIAAIHVFHPNEIHGQARKQRHI